jgi:hypothetical protein
MATSYKILGQSAPSATTNTDVYTVPSSTQTIVSTITVVNRSASDATFRIAARPGGATISNEHYFGGYDSTVSSNDVVALTIGVTLNAGDVITVYASSADLSFNVFGSEIS